MKTKINVFLLTLSIFAVAVLASCNQSTSSNDNNELSDTSGQAISVNPVEHSKQFPGADLKVSSITAEKVGTDSALLTVKYDVQNFTLTEHTDDSNATHMAN